MNKRRAIYAGSFDPLTEGHMYMIREGAKLFDQLVVAVGSNPDKRYTFPAEERIAVIAESVKDVTNVSVAQFQGKFLVDFASDIGASYLLRGIRTEEDYTFERTMRNVNADMNPKITSVFLMPPREFAEVSSSFVKGLVGPVGWEKIVRKYVPPAAFDLLVRKTR
ncbi:MAG TPA: pantetheine-phosphate adenylyltransferase [Candidatus Brocadiia bacterium]|nr:pantetheine-phosphate adenylyltransferase [Candidatus Brocadiia bacterium]